jgi:hypothetical protein
MGGEDTNVRVQKDGSLCYETVKHLAKLWPEISKALASGPIAVWEEVVKQTIKVSIADSIWQGLRRIMQAQARID